MSEIDLTLPDTVAGMARYRERPMTLYPFALYNLADNQIELSDIVEECNSLCPRDDYVCFRKMSGISSLKSLIDLHLNTTAQESFHAGLFLVVTSENWRSGGLIIVTLGDDDGKSDKFTLKAADSGILLVNLQIGNTDWYEAKENYALTEDDDPQDPPPGGIFPDGASKKKPGTGFYIGFYAIPGVDPDQLIEATEPFFNTKAPEDRICRFEGYLQPNVDLVSQAMDSWHPQACMTNPYLCKMYMLLADSVNYKEDGLLMCNVKEHKTRRVPCSQGELVPNFCKIAQGRQSWDG